MQINVFNDVPIDVNTNAFLWITPNSTDRLMMIDHGDFTWEEERIPDVNEIKSIYQTPVYTCKDKIEFTGYELVNQRRISRTEFEYSMRVLAANAGGQDIENISFRLDKVPANTTVINDTVEFSLIEARKESLSDNTFTIRTDRNIEGLEKDVAWSVCTCSERSRIDMNKDWIVNFVDLARLAEIWLNEAPGMSEDLYPDSVIDLKDFTIFAESWLAQ